MYVAKTRALISCVVTAQLICVFVFAYAKTRFSHDAAHILWILDKNLKIILFLSIRGMFKNNVDFCYKKLSSQHRLIQTIPFLFGNCM